MESLLVDHQQDLYGVVFYGTIIFFAVVEFLFPRLKPEFSVLPRWSSNLGLGLIGVLMAGFVIPVGTLTAAEYSRTEGWGLMNQTALPLWLTLPVGVLVLDLVKYWEHWLLHRVPLLWRLHVVHHADLDVDFTTGFRHHPFEALAVAVALPLTVLAAGVPPVAVIAFQIMAAFAAIYTHANIRYPLALEKALRLVLMTRYAHLVHHSAKRAETDSNYGQVFLFWDRLFGTYRAEPDAGVDGITTGVEYFRSARDLVIDRVLTMPFRVPKTAAAPSSDKPEDPLPEPPAA